MKKAHNREGQKTGPFPLNKGVHGPYPKKEIMAHISFQRLLDHTKHTVRSSQKLRTRWCHKREENSTRFTSLNFLVSTFHRPFLK